MTPGNVGLAIADGKAILAAIQKQIVADQVQQHCQITRNCKQCGAELPTNGHHTSTFRSLYGEIPMSVRRVRGCRCQGQRGQSFSTMFARRNPTSPELNFISSKLAALVPFRQAASILQVFLPVAETVNAGTIRNRTMRVGKRLEKQRDQFVAPPADATPASKEVVIGLDGGYVKNCHRRPERNFEIIVGKVIGPDDANTRFAFVCGTVNKDEGRLCVGEALRARGAGKTTAVTVLTQPDGERSIGARWQCRGQAARAGRTGTSQMGTVERQDDSRLVRLVRLSQWARSDFLQSTKPTAKLANGLPDLVRYVELSRDSMPNYGQRYRLGAEYLDGVRRVVGQRDHFATDVEAAEDALEPTHGSWVPAGSIHVLNDTMEQAFQRMHTGFRPELNRQPRPLND